MLVLDRDDLHYPTAQSETVDIAVTKHRNGPVGRVKLAFHPVQMRFRDHQNVSDNDEAASEVIR